MIGLTKGQGVLGARNWWIRVLFGGFKRGGVWKRCDFCMYSERLRVDHQGKGVGGVS